MLHGCKVVFIMQIHVITLHIISQIMHNVTINDAMNVKQGLVVINGGGNCKKNHVGEL